MRQRLKTCKCDANASSASSQGDEKCVKGFNKPSSGLVQNLRGQIAFQQ